ncbi:UNVERIFIED_CONTAM: hypothetical protein GTU68_067399 [Idotea baltica]|nr:hypothetical protein [Idotea baltica]
MAIGKGVKKTGKKGQKKKVIDPLSRKEWYQLRAPAPFKAESFGYTLANRTMGLKDSIKGRVVEAVQADLAPGQDAYAWRKIRLVIDDTRGRDALTSFYGVDMTRDQFCALIKKRKTLIEAVQDIKSQDGYVLRVFAIAFTKESFGQKRKTNYALSSQQKSIRRKINEIIAKEISKANANQILNLFTS